MKVKLILPVLAPRLTALRHSFRISQRASVALERVHGARFPYERASQSYEHH